MEAASRERLVRRQPLEHRLERLRRARRADAVGSDGGDDAASRLLFEIARAAKEVCRRAVRRLRFLRQPDREAAICDLLRDRSAQRRLYGALERAFVEADRVVVRVHPRGGVAGEFVVTRRRRSVAGGPPVIRQRLERSLIGGRILEGASDRAVARPQLGTEEVAVDRLARKPVAKTELRRRDLLDELEVARAPQRREQRVGLAAERRRQQVETECPPDGGRLRDDPPFFFAQRPQPSEQRRADVLWDLSLARHRCLGIVTLDRALEQFLGEERIAVAGQRDRAPRALGQGDPVERFVDERLQFRATQRTEVDAGGAGRAHDASDRRRRGLRRIELVGAYRRDDEHAHALQRGPNVREEVERSGVRPMQILDDDHERAAGREAGEMRRHRFELLALAGRGTQRERLGREPAERLEHWAIWPTRELETRALTDLPARIRERRAEFGDQPRLAQPCVAGDQHETTVRRACLKPSLAQICEFL